MSKSKSKEPIVVPRDPVNHDKIDLPEFERVSEHFFSSYCGYLMDVLLPQESFDPRDETFFTNKNPLYEHLVKFFANSIIVAKAESDKILGYVERMKEVFDLTIQQSRWNTYLQANMNGERFVQLLKRDIDKYLAEIKETVAAEQDHLRGAFVDTLTSEPDSQPGSQLDPTRPEDPYARFTLAAADFNQKAKELGEAFVRNYESTDLWNENAFLIELWALVNRHRRAFELPELEFHVSGLHQCAIILAALKSGQYIQPRLLFAGEEFCPAGEIMQVLRDMMKPRS